MASYFVACSAQAEGAHAVHDRSRCPPACFPAGATEYLGEFLDASQAVAVARLRYRPVRRCAHCEVSRPMLAPLPQAGAGTLIPLRP